MKMLRRTFNKRKSTSGCITQRGQFSVRHFAHKWEFKNHAVTFFTPRGFTTKDTENACKGVASRSISARCCKCHAVLVQDSLSQEQSQAQEVKAFIFFFLPN